MWHKAALVGAMFALVTWIAFSLVAQPPRIQEKLRIETERVLVDAGLGNIQASVRGRNAILEGQVAAPVEAARAEGLIVDIAGIRVVDNRLQVREDSVAPPPTYLEIRVEAGGVNLLGGVPNEGLRLAVLESALEVFGSERVIEQLTVDAAIPDGAAMAAAAGIVRALADVRDGVKVRLKGDGLRLSGTVASAEERRRVEEQARKATPGVRLFFSALTVEGS